MKLNGKVDIALRSDRLIRIALIDESSGVQFLEMNIAPEQLGLALTGLGHQEFTYELHSPELVGMKVERKNELVPWNGPYGSVSPEALTAALAPFETDGWMAYRDDLTNHHMRRGDAIQSVGFHRYVDPVTGEAVTP